MRLRQAKLITVASAGMLALLIGQAAAADQAIARHEVAGDAIPLPLDSCDGDANRGRRLVLDREKGNCLICHRVPVPNEPSQGDLAPSLAGVGGRLNAGQLRYRLVDQSKLNPATLMPPYYRVDGLQRVADRYRGQPVFTAQEIEDVVAWLASLKE